jgi:DNA repair protein RAD16
VNAGTVLNNYAHIFDILIRLRQVVDHPYLVLFRTQSPASSDPIASRASDPEEVLCEICRETPIDPRRSSCQHLFCFGCISDFLQVESADTAATCPTCQSPLSIDLAAEVPEGGSFLSSKRMSLGRRSFLRHIDLQKFQSSTKLEALMQVRRRTRRV